MNRSKVREVTNLAWPQSPYSSAHRPIPTATRLLTGLWISPSGWAAVHLPLHRTRILDAATARLGIQAAALPDASAREDLAEAGAHLWSCLDRLLLAARRQAVAVAGIHLAVPLQRVHQHLARTAVRAPGIASLLPEWPTPTYAPPEAEVARARLLELADADLPQAAADLIARYATTPRGWSGAGAHHEAAAGVEAAAAVALAAASWIGAYRELERLDFTAVLEEAIGDQLTFASYTGNAAASPQARYGEAAADVSQGLSR
ncbi:hypothetical protein GCM10028781_23010 [Nostocoides australiense]